MTAIGAGQGHSLALLTDGTVRTWGLGGGGQLGNNSQANSATPVQVSGLTQVKFTAGSDSHGRALPAQQNRAVLRQNGTDVTSQIVVNP